MEIKFMAYEISLSGQGMMGVHHGVLCMNAGKWMGSGSWFRPGTAGLGWAGLGPSPGIAGCRQEKVSSKAEEESVEVVFQNLSK